MNMITSNHRKVKAKSNSRHSTKKMLVASFVVTAITCSSVSANEVAINSMNSKDEKHQERLNKENIGFGSGALIGAVAAGPLGAIVAGIGGSIIAKLINVSDEKDELLISLREQKENNRIANEEVKQQYLAKIENIEDTFHQQLSILEGQQEKIGQLQASNLLMSLQFSTGSSDISPHYQDQILALAEILKNSPKLKIDLSGYTDLTGAEALNQTLSVARVDSVKSVLMKQGVDAKQIATFAYGETAPVVANKQREVSFYDRRVVMKLHQTVEKNTNQMANNN